MIYYRWGINVIDFNLKHVQRVALYLIKSDLRCLYMVINNINLNQPNNSPSLLPYMGVIIDGEEDWIKVVNNSSRAKFEIPLFNESEQMYNEKMRGSIKLWQKDYTDIYELFQNAYNIRNEHFGIYINPMQRK